MYFCSPPRWLCAAGVGDGADPVQTPYPAGVSFHTSILVLLYQVIHILLPNETYSFQRTAAAVPLFFLGKGQIRREIMEFCLITVL